MRLLLLSAVGLVVIVVAGGAYFEATYLRDFSSTHEPTMKASRDPAVIAQGKYLVHAVAHCSGCHGTTGEIEKKTVAFKDDLSGGFTIHAGPFGDFRASNITSDKATGIGDVSDGKLARAIRSGVDRHGRLAPFMSFAVGEMADEDLLAIISYLRTQGAVKNEVAPDTWGPIAKVLSGSFNPRTRRSLLYVAPGKLSVERGEYLANGPAHCIGCHTEADPSAGFAFVGAHFAGEPAAEPDPTEPASEFISPNLTPDPNTGAIADWTEEVFVARFRTGRVLAGSKMPWDNFKKMTDEDLRSIYRYLKTLAPVYKMTGPSHRAAGWKPPS